jgi:hypothetical protein
MNDMKPKQEVIWNDVEVSHNGVVLDEVQSVSMTFKLPLKIMRCRHCMYSYKHTYGKMYYCRKRYSRRTAYGHAKIKMNDRACVMFLDSRI